MLVRNASQIGMCFTCLMFSFSGPCELLLLLLFVLLSLRPELWCV